MVLRDYKGKKIRLESERWKHINHNHPETKNQISFLCETMEFPDFVQEGNNNERLAVKRFKKTPVTKDKFCIVVYKLKGIDGFVITCYCSRRPSFKRNLVWKKP